MFAWAKTAPDELGIETDADEDDPGGPRFVRYFGPVLSALQSLGGSATPEQVFGWIKENLDVPDEEITAVTKGGQSKFENKVGWARYYLSRAGLIDGSKRGVWALTPEGEVITLTNAQALAVFKEVRKQFSTTGDESEDEAAPDTFAGHELFSDPDRRFWFVGAS